DGDVAEGLAGPEPVVARNVLGGRRGRRPDDRRDRRRRRVLLKAGADEQDGDRDREQEAGRRAVALDLGAPAARHLPAGDGPDLAPQPGRLGGGGRAPVLAARAEGVENAPGGADERARRAARERAGEI